MDVNLRKWQNNATIALNQFFNTTTTDGEPMCGIVDVAPGGGKTIFALNYAFTHNYNKIVVVVPSKHLKKQWSDAAARHYGKRLYRGNATAFDPTSPRWDGLIMTYSAMNPAPIMKLHSMCDENTLVIADEMHHVSDMASWGEAFKYAFINAKHIVGLTGTPWTSNGGSIPFVKYNDDGFVAPVFTYSISDAVRGGDCRKMEFNQLNVDSLKIDEFDETTEMTPDDPNYMEMVEMHYSALLRMGSTMEKLFNAAHAELIRYRNVKIPDAGGLIVAQSHIHAMEWQRLLYKITGKKYPVVTTHIVDAHAEIDYFRENTECEWLISVNMVSEGVDIPRLRCVLYATNVRTELRITQIAGRAVRMTDPNDKLPGLFFFLSHPAIDKQILKMVEKTGRGIKIIKRDDELLPPGSGPDPGPGPGFPPKREPLVSTPENPLPDPAPGMMYVDDAGNTYIRADEIPFNVAVYLVPIPTEPIAPPSITATIDTREIIIDNSDIENAMKIYGWETVKTSMALIKQRPDMFLESPLYAICDAVETGVFSKTFITDAIAATSIDDERKTLNTVIEHFGGNPDETENSTIGKIKQTLSKTILGV